MLMRCSGIICLAIGVSVEDNMGVAEVLVEGDVGVIGFCELQLERREAMTNKNTIHLQCINSPIGLSNLTRCFSSIQYFLSILKQRHINHFSIQSKCALALFLTRSKRVYNPLCIGNCFVARRKRGLNRFDLRGMDNLFA